MTDTTSAYLTVDEDCAVCPAYAEERECAEGGAKAVVTDCGHYPQPRDIAALEDGLRFVCSGCRAV